MTRLVLYVGHPVAPTASQLVGFNIKVYGSGDSPASKEDRSAIVRLAIEENLAGAMKWLSWLRRSFPETAFIAPWIADIQSGADDSDPAARERGLVDCCAVVERCDGIVLVGPRISTGMARERDHGLAHGMDDSTIRTFAVYDLTRYSIDGGDQWCQSDRGEGTSPEEFAIWAECFLA